MTTIAHHALLELFGCPAGAIDDPEAVRRALHAAADALSTPILGEAYHRFSPQGVSGVALIAESHLSVHTWPEAGYVAADVFTCGAIHPEQALPVLARAFGAASWLAADVVRGMVEFAPFEPRLAPQVLVAAGVLSRPVGRDPGGRPILDGRRSLLRALGWVDVTGIAEEDHAAAVRAEALAVAGRGGLVSVRLQQLLEDPVLVERLSEVAGAPVVAGSATVEVQDGAPTPWTSRPRGAILRWVVEDAGGGALEIGLGDTVRRVAFGTGRMVLIRGELRHRAVPGDGRRVVVAVPVV